MRPILMLISTFLLAFGVQQKASAQITADFIATSIARDSGNPREQYLDYSLRLAQTLKQLTPQQLERVFGKVTNVVVPETLNQLLEMGDVNFQGGSSVLSSEAKDELNKVAEFLSLNPKARISIEGHAWYQDNRSQSLSEERAESAKIYLSSLGVSSDRMESEGFGATKPLVSDPDRSKTTANRRIEIRVIE